MPCHVPATSVSSHRRSALSMLSAPIIAVRLDLDKPGERAAHELVQRFGSGRWPLWRIFGMRRHEQTLLLAVVWRRGHRLREYALASVSLVETWVQWRSMSSETAVRRALCGAGFDAAQSA
jgi:hypothetical protein